MTRSTKVCRPKGCIFNTGGPPWPDCTCSVEDIHAGLETAFPKSAGSAADRIYDELADTDAFAEGDVGIRIGNEVVAVVGNVDNEGGEPVVSLAFFSLTSGTTMTLTRAAAVALAAALAAAHETAESCHRAAFGRCVGYGKDILLATDGTVCHHRIPVNRPCPGSRKLPA